MNTLYFIGFANLNSVRKQVQESKLVGCIKGKMGKEVNWRANVPSSSPWH